MLQCPYERLQLSSCVRLSWLPTPERYTDTSDFLGGGQNTRLHVHFNPQESQTGWGIFKLVYCKKNTELLACFTCDVESGCALSGAGCAEDNNVVEIVINKFHTTLLHDLSPNGRTPSMNMQTFQSKANRGQSSGWTGRRQYADLTLSLASWAPVPRYCVAWVIFYTVVYCNKQWSALMHTPPLWEGKVDKISPFARSMAFRDHTHFV